MAGSVPWKEKDWKIGKNKKTGSGIEVRDWRMGMGMNGEDFYTKC